MKNILDYEHNHLVELIVGTDRFSRYLVNDYTSDQILDDNTDWDCVDRCLADLSIKDSDDDENIDNLMFERRVDLCNDIRIEILSRGSHKLH